MKGLALGTDPAKSALLNSKLDSAVFRTLLKSELHYMIKEKTMNNGSKIIPEELRSSDWLKDAQMPEGEEKVAYEFADWLAAIRNNRLAEKATRLWRLFRNGTLSGFEKALVVGALLYCIAPIDTVPDLIPLVGWVDDLAVVLGVLAYLDRGKEKPESSITTNPA